KIQHLIVIQSLRFGEKRNGSVDEPLKKTFQDVHQGYPDETLSRFLRAREWNVSSAHKMLLDCLNWRLQNQIDSILSKPILPVEQYKAVRDSQLIGMSGYSKEGHPVFAIGVGLSTYDKASIHYYVQSHIQINEYRDRVVLPSATKTHGRHISTCIKILDMTGLKLSSLSLIKLLTAISSIDDQNYPEKCKTYYIVNAPYIFSACWKLACSHLNSSCPDEYMPSSIENVVKPLLQERTRKKIQVLSGCGQDELLKIMDYDSLPHFCRKQGSGSSKHLSEACKDCFSYDHPFHQQLYDYIKQQASLLQPAAPLTQRSFHVDLPETEESVEEVAQSIESEVQKLEISESAHGSPSSED
ncbi:hypothetical protein V2J09_012311, partial [Rumex salicifolius]